MWMAFSPVLMAILRTLPPTGRPRRLSNPPDALWFSAWDNVNSVLDPCED